MELILGTCGLLRLLPKSYVLFLTISQYLIQTIIYLKSYYNRWKLNEGDRWERTNHPDQCYIRRGNVRNEYKDYLKIKIFVLEKRVLGCEHGSVGRETRRTETTLAAANDSKLHSETVDSSLSAGAMSRAPEMEADDYESEKWSAKSCCIPFVYSLRRERSRGRILSSRFYDATGNNGLRQHPFYEGPTIKMDICYLEICKSTYRDKI